MTTSNPPASITMLSFPPTLLPHPYSGTESHKGRAPGDQPASSPPPFPPPRSASSDGMGIGREGRRERPGRDDLSSKGDVAEDLSSASTSHPPPLNRPAIAASPAPLGGPRAMLSSAHGPMEGQAFAFASISFLHPPPAPRVEVCRHVYTRIAGSFDTPLSAPFSLSPSSRAVSADVGTSAGFKLNPLTAAAAKYSSRCSPRFGFFH